MIYLLGLAFLGVLALEEEGKSACIKMAALKIMVSTLVARGGSSFSIFPLIKSAPGDLLLCVSLINLVTSLAEVGVTFSMQFDTFASEEYWSGETTEKIVTFGLNVL
uniref:Uncharacterized protein n=1 Tax=Vespula pensylvanica TaxID=30213 RepID=A0A834JP78_VESPE|nr:hypothetical protein H0235_017472 [Vespula pensylvanica]